MNQIEKKRGVKNLNLWKYNKHVTTNIEGEYVSSHQTRISADAMNGNSSDYGVC